jgi:exonuclease III
MNVRTIREQRCREELASNLDRYNIDILGIQEHRIVHDEPVKYENILGKTLITTSAERNSAGAAVGGVGILLNTHAKASLASIKAYNNRILIANFQGNPATTVIVTYCPTNVAK